MTEDIDMPMLADVKNFVSFFILLQYSEARKKAVKASLKKYNLKDFERLFKNCLLYTSRCV